MSLRQVRLRIFTVTAVVITALATNFLEPGANGYEIAGDLVLAFLGGWTITAVGRVPLAYSGGWLSGRLALFASLREAQSRGMTQSEWLLAEFERDVVVHGLMSQAEWQALLEEADDLYRNGGSDTDGG